MKKVVLISCVSKKMNKRAKAKDLYISPLFKLNLLYARSIEPDQIYILSAKYGLLSLNDTIAPYDLTLNNMTAAQRKSWAELVLKQLRKILNIRKTHFIFLAGKKYRQYLIPHLSSFSIPMEGLSIGKQLQYLKRKVEK